MALLDTTQKRVIAAVLAVVLVLGAVAGAYLLTRPSDQELADSFAQDATALLVRESNGESVGDEGTALIAQLEEDTNCTFVGGLGGPIPAEPGRSELISSVRAQEAEFLAQNDEGIVGEFFGENFGAVVVLDCSTPPVDTTTGDRTE